MDIDEVGLDQPKDLLSLFDTTPEHFPWQGARPAEIRSRRGLMGNLLFFDILLQVGGIEDPEMVYPPTDVASLRRLLGAVEGATYDSMKRQCLVYYLLKWHGDARELAYAETKCISPHYVSIADGYWHLDVGINLERAIGLLSDARIVKDNTTKIMETLTLAKDPTPLILKYVRTCRPALTAPEDLQKYLIAMAETNLMDAWQFQRTFSEKDKTRKDLIHSLLEWSITPKPRMQPLTQLLSIPLSTHEESILQDFATHPTSQLPPPSVSILRDFVCVRLIQSCKYIEAIKFDRKFPAVGSNVKGTWASQRRRILAEILVALPAAERVLLEQNVNGHTTAHGANVSASGNGISWPNVSASAPDLGMSWEEIGPRASSSFLRAAPRTSNGGGPVFDRTTAGAPRRSLVTTCTQPLSMGSISLSASRNIFTPGASTSTPNSREPVSLSTQTTLISQSSSQPLNFSTSQMKFGASVFTSAQHLSAVQPASAVKNGSGAAKSNAFLARNAFFEPPTVERLTINGNHIQPSRDERQTSTRRSPVSPVRLDDSLSQDAHQKASDDDILPVNNSEVMEHDGGASDSEQEDLGFSLFGKAPVAVSASQTQRQKTPTRAPPAARATSAQKMPPGAFQDSEDEQPRQTRLKPRPASPPAQAPAAPVAAPEPAKKRSSRKRAASPAVSPAEEKFRRSIPGTLFEDEDEDSDDVGPLPPRPKRASAVRKARPSRASSRVGSMEPDDGDTGKPVRRSTRLSVATSPTAEAKTVARPRKSTRTSGIGATATGRKKR